MDLDKLFKTYKHLKFSKTIFETSNFFGYFKGSSGSFQKSSEKFSAPEGPQHGFLEVLEDSVAF